MFTPIENNLLKLYVFETVPLNAPVTFKPFLADQSARFSPLTNTLALLALILANSCWGRL